MTNDFHYAGIRYNEMLGRAEVHEQRSSGTWTIRPWTDADEAESRNYIEREFQLYSRDRHADALRLLFKERVYNPLKDIIEDIKWDGTPRVCDFLHHWAKADDNDYTREVSRLIFAGGINRLYNPGCKYDVVPILIGTRQGEGKSSLIEFLAVHSDYFGNISYVEGQQSIEQLQGRWICEIPEMFAVTKYKEQEQVKAFITRAIDSYRKPYERNVSELPRRCIFIGTSNDATPLVDKTGNRRYFPVEIHSNGYEIRRKEGEIRDYIMQCWAEARELFVANKMPPYPNPKYQELYTEAQENAMQDDWRVGAIMAFLDKKNPGELTCVRELCYRALSPNQTMPHEPTLAEAKDLGRLMNRLPGWGRCDNPRKVGAFGKQRAWVKLGAKDEEADKDPDDPSNW